MSLCSFSTAEGYDTIDLTWRIIFKNPRQKNETYPNQFYYEIIEWVVFESNDPGWLSPTRGNIYDIAKPQSYWNLHTNPSGKLH